MRQDVRVADWVVVMRFAVPIDGADAFEEEARDVARLLAGFDGCTGVDVARASDDRELWVMVARWDSVGQLPQGVVVLRGQAERGAVPVPGDR